MRQSPYHIAGPALSVGHLQVHVHDEDTLTINVSVERHEPEKDNPEAKYIRGAPHACLHTWESTGHLLLATKNYRCLGLHVLQGLLFETEGCTSQLPSSHCLQQVLRLPY